MENNKITETIIGCAIDLHKAQILTYLKFSKKEIGLLINFNVVLLKQGIKRFILTPKVTSS